MKKEKPCIQYNFFPVDSKQVLKELGKEQVLAALDEMLMIRNFEQRGEQAYQSGKVWGFFHSYAGQEAIQVGAVHALERKKQLWVTTYRCHALALLLGMTPKEGMCELYGKANGNAQGRGGSMHLYTDNMFGGNGIVGGQWPMGAGLAFSLKYRKIKDAIAVCFGGDGSVVQGTFHEMANLAKLWGLPLLIVIENNQLGMGTQIERAICNFPIGESFAKGYGIKSYTVDGMNFFKCYAAFKEAAKYIQEHQEPVILEAVTHRFRGHSISDSAEYRSKEDLVKIKELDPIDALASFLEQEGVLTKAEFEAMNHKRRDEMVEVMKFADASPFPNPETLEEGVIIG